MAAAGAAAGAPHGAAGAVPAPVPAVERLDAAAAAARLRDYRAGTDGAAWTLADVVASVPAVVAASDVEALRRWRVPRTTEDGTCSRPGDFEPAPFEVADTLWGVPAHAAAEEVAAHAAIRRLAALRGVASYLAAVTRAEWAGIYRVLPPDGDRPATLVKEAYVGAASRPYFPLTPAFAAHSNNSTVAMTASTVVIHDVKRIARDDPYYTCDGKVRSEVCTPILSPTGAVLGIIDVEAYAPAAFTPPAALGAVLDAAVQLGAAHLLLPLPT